jgi:hypothetical protein
VKNSSVSVFSDNLLNCFALMHWLHCLIILLCLIVLLIFVYPNSRHLPQFWTIIKMLGTLGFPLSWFVLLYIRLDYFN